MRRSHSKIYNRFVALGLLILTSLLGVSCAEYFRDTNSPAHPAGIDFTEQKLIRRVGGKILVPAYGELKTKTDQLSQSIQNWCSSLHDRSKALGSQDMTSEVSKPNVAVDHFSKAKQAWKEAMLAFHFIDAIPFGPSKTLHRNKGPLVTRSIYTLGDFSSCETDFEIISPSKSDPQDRDNDTYIRGMQALEYILFSDIRVTSCPNQRNYEKVHQWLNEKPEVDRWVDRCMYAARVVSEVSEDVEKLWNEWDPARLNFSEKAVREMADVKFGEVSSQLGSALFNIERTKDDRWARPLGIKECTEGVRKCSRYLEHPYSQLGLPATVVRLRALEQVALGKVTASIQRSLDTTSENSPLDTADNGLGLDDYLVSKNFINEAKALTNNIVALRQKAEALLSDGAMAQQFDRLPNEMNCSSEVFSSNPGEVSNSITPICEVYGKMVNLSTWMKSDFLAALSAMQTSPMQQGDND